MRILYFSVHEILEYDDLRMFTAAGHEVFSCGCYMRPMEKKYEFRQPKPEFFCGSLISAFDIMGLCRDFVELFDVVLVNHFVSPLIQHEESLFCRPVIYRTIGQSTIETEAVIQAFAGRLFVVRYSERERALAGFGRTDAVIYFGKDLADYGEWKGGSHGVTFHNDYLARTSESVPRAPDYLEIIKGLDLKIYSRNNNEFKNWGGVKSLAEMDTLLQEASSYFYVWSVRASYTLNLIEAMLVGTPVVAPSGKYVDKVLTDSNYPNWAIRRYEVGALLSDESAMLYDEAEDARTYLKLAARQDPAVSRMAQRVRVRARQKFDMNFVVERWNEAFGRL